MLERAGKLRSDGRLMARRKRTPPAAPRRSNLSSRREVPDPPRATLSRQVFVTEAWMIPTRWLKWISAVSLLPICWVASKTFFEEFSRAGLRHHFWATDEFRYFAGGALAWTVAFFVFPRPLVVYVFGHELTHALWVWMQGGVVSDFKVGREGGYIIADRRDFVVSLAPYFFPLYSIAVIGIYAALAWYYPEAWHYRHWMFAALGLTWGFHLSFTCWMIPKQQTDLLLHGTFFSLVVIYLANLLVLTVGLIVACPQVHWDHYGRELMGNAADVVTWGCHQFGVQPWWL